MLNTCTSIRSRYSCIDTEIHLTGDNMWKNRVLVHPFIQCHSIIIHRTGQNIIMCFLLSIQ